MQQVIRATNSHDFTSKPPIQLSGSIQHGGYTFNEEKISPSALNADMRMKEIIIVFIINAVWFMSGLV